MKERKIDYNKHSEYVAELLERKRTLLTQLKEIDKLLEKELNPKPDPTPHSSFIEFDQMVVEKAYKVPRPYQSFTRMCREGLL